ncbi:GroES-like protein [Daldinia caldariorum]|uniref:GroES-like protein n=1 Tax=Daldinia caldariorum TaxID=326644 RepID=UPI0020087A53|nr:GroES-like protein [Daldinia caldariorum]KAI1466144.1 GroES-like protein [Daldinia caldariorum]
MSTTTTNRTFWQDKTGVPGTIRETAVSLSDTTLFEGEILVKVHAWGLNPVDAYLQDVPLPFVKFPLVPGTDVAGTIVRVGSGRFQVGDRVLAYAPGISFPERPERGAFQEYVVLDSALAARAPDSVSFAEAAVFPLCFATAAHALFDPEFLALPLPPPPGSRSFSSAGKGAETEKPVLVVWGGASAVGSNAIQLARAAGLEVVATCSPRNFAYVRSLGAGAVFDYNGETAVDDIVAELDGGGDAGRCVVGIFQAAGITGDAVAPCCQVSARLRRPRRKPFVACANAIPEGAVPEGVEAKFVLDWKAGRGMYHDVTSTLFAEFLEEALRSGTYKVAPKPEVVGTRGLEGIQEGLDIVRKGVSAKKIVVLAE